MHTSTNCILLAVFTINCSLTAYVDVSNVNLNLLQERRAKTKVESTQTMG